ncbi:hypothetical protein RCL1_004659 [Eukaryota sp. TZLM3-RCL]
MKPQVFSWNVDFYLNDISPLTHDFISELHHLYFGFLHFERVKVDLRSGFTCFFNSSLPELSLLSRTDNIVVSTENRYLNAVTFLRLPSPLKIFSSPCVLLSSSVKAYLSAPDGSRHALVDYGICLTCLGPVDNQIVSSPPSQYVLPSISASPSLSPHPLPSPATLNETAPILSPTSHSSSPSGSVYQNPIFDRFLTISKQTSPLQTTANFEQSSQTFETQYKSLAVSPIVFSSEHKSLETVEVQPQERPRRSRNRVGNVAINRSVPVDFDSEFHLVSRRPPPLAVGVVDYDFPPPLSFSNV